MAKRHNTKLSRRCRPQAPPVPVAAGQAATIANVTIPVRTSASRWRHAAVAGLLALICAGLYGRTVDFPFQFDDVIYLENNPLVRDAKFLTCLSDLREFISRPTRIGIEPDLALNMATRPVSYVTFYANYVFDGYHPRWYRVVNIAIHASNAFLIYALVMLLLPRAGSRRFIAATAALLFAVHPLATESVTYIIQRMTALATCFYLLGLCLYLKALASVERGPRIALKGLAVVSVVLAMLSKECSVTAPIMALGLDWVVRRTPFRKAIMNALPLLACLPIVPVLVLASAWALNNGDLSLGNAVNIVNSRDTPITPVHYAITELTVVLQYLRLLVWPSGLNIDPEWPLYKSLLRAPVLGAIAFFAALIAAAALWMRRHPGDARVACVFAFVCWFFGTIWVSSGFVPLPDLMAEHRSYLPSVGIFIAVACLATGAAGKLGASRLYRAGAVSAVLLCIVALGTATWKRNDVWRSSISLWEDAVAKSPGRARAWGNVAHYYGIAGRLDDSLIACDKAIAIDPQMPNPSILKAQILVSQNQPGKALETMHYLIENNKRVKTVPDARFTVARALLSLGRFEEAESMLTELIQHVPTHWQSYVALGTIYSGRNSPGKALALWRNALQLVPGNGALRELVENTERQTALVER